MTKLLPGLAAGAFLLALLLATLVLLGGTAQAAECGRASWYGPGFHGKLTASGARYDQNAMTAAHKTMAFGTKLRVTHRGRAVTVTVTDRGPFVRGRSLDLSKGAASKLGMIPAGVGDVCWERVR
jgi:rare lipoprotein A